MSYISRIQESSKHRRLKAVPATDFEGSYGHVRRQYDGWSGPREQSKGFRPKTVFEFLLPSCSLEHKINQERIKNGRSTVPGRCKSIGAKASDEYDESDRNIFAKIGRQIRIEMQREALRRAFQDDKSRSPLIHSLPGLEWFLESENRPVISFDELLFTLLDSLLSIQDQEE